MPLDIPIRCSCGTLRGVARGLGPDQGNRTQCFCTDCQAYAHFLGRPDEILDAHGGSDIFQTSPSRISLDEGSEQLACMRLSERGLLRWYARCCNTPLGNTLPSQQMAFVGIVHLCMDHAASGIDRDAALGPIRTSVYSEQAKAGVTPSGKPSSALSSLLTLLPIMIKARLRGQHAPSPFFDGESGAPSASPTVLSPKERAQLKAAVEA